MLKKLLKVLVALLVVLPIAFAALVWYQLQPRAQDLPLPDRLFSLESDRGQATLAAADAIADYDALLQTWEAQELTSYCGVANPFKDTRVISYCNVALGGIPRRGKPVAP